jgi:hypothetical protein
LTIGMMKKIKMKLSHQRGSKSKQSNTGYFKEISEAEIKETSADQ